MSSGWLHHELRMTSVWLQDDYRMTSGWLQDDFRMTSRGLADDFQRTCRWLPGDFQWRWKKNLVWNLSLRVKFVTSLSKLIVLVKGEWLRSAGSVCLIIVKFAVTVLVILHNKCSALMCWLSVVSSVCYFRVLAQNVSQCVSSVC